MSSLTRRRAEELIDRFASSCVLVVGDLMLDRYVWGEVRRISPEAPVPVVRARRETLSLGGAGNVVSNLTALGARVRCAGILGDDEGGRQVRERLEACGADLQAVLTQPGRPTTVKMRIIAHNQQVVRVDQEDDAYLDAAYEQRMIDIVLALLEGSSAVVISDYAKGAISASLLERLLGGAASAGVPVIVDPKLAHFPLYQPVTVLTPNVEEASRATAIEIRGDDDVDRAGRRILQMLEARAVLVTRGDRGMSLFERDGPETIIPARTREVYDVTGAGDTVVATLALALSVEASLPEAAELSNRAAGLVVSKLGTAVVAAKELLSSFS
jgi:D-beta-D-heptose 7-phosphate kinase/D-beta-D-heptose 1-phosphate adenosyltransferase